jgi:hypothetical protein
MNIKKGQKFVMKLDKYFSKSVFKTGDIIEYIGNKRSTTGMLSIFVNQNGVKLKIYTIWVDKFLENYTNVL